LKNILSNEEDSTSFQAKNQKLFSYFVSLHVIALEGHFEIRISLNIYAVNLKSSRELDAIAIIITV
jgi:hypothetical protein